MHEQINGSYMMDTRKQCPPTVGDIATAMKRRSGDEQHVLKRVLLQGAALKKWCFKTVVDFAVRLTQLHFSVFINPEGIPMLCLHCRLSCKRLGWHSKWRYLSQVQMDATPSLFLNQQGNGEIYMRLAWLCGPEDEIAITELLCKRPSDLAVQADQPSLLPSSPNASESDAGISGPAGRVKPLNPLFAGELASDSHQVSHRDGAQSLFDSCTGAPRGGAAAAATSEETQSARSRGGLFLIKPCTIHRVSASTGVFQADGFIKSLGVWNISYFKSGVDESLRDFDNELHDPFFQLP